MALQLSLTIIQSVQTSSQHSGRFSSSLQGNPEPVFCPRLRLQSHRSLEASELYKPSRPERVQPVGRLFCRQPNATGHTELNQQRYLKRSTSCHSAGGRAAVGEILFALWMSNKPTVPAFYSHFPKANPLPTWRAGLWSDHLEGHFRLLRNFRSEVSKVKSPQGFCPDASLL